MKSIYNVPQVRTQSTTSLTNIDQLLNVQVTGVQNNDILVYNSPKWVNRPQVLNNNSDVTITNPVVNNYLGHNGTEWINKEIALNDLSDVALTSLSVNDILKWDGDYWSNYPLSNGSLATLSDVQITSVQNNDNIVYNSATSKYINKKKYEEYDSYVSLSNQTITAVARTIYFCNLATINLPASTLGECIKIINSLGTNCTFAYTGIIYHLVNNFNTSYTTTDSAEIVLEGILGGNWQIKSFTGRWNNNNTNRRLVNNNLEDLRNMNIVLPVVNNYLRFDGTNWVNSMLPSFLTSFNSRTGPAITPANGDYSISQITNASVLADSNNININTPLNNQVLTYNTSTSKWINQNASSAGVSSFNTRTGAVTIQSGDVNINQLGNVNIVSPTVLDSLRFDGTNWTNQKVNHFWTCNSAGNLSNNQFVFFNGFGQSATEAFTQMYITQTITITKMDVYLQTPPGGATARTFNLRVTASTLATVTISGANQFGSSSFIINPVAGSFLSVQNVNTGSPANGAGLINITYNFR